VDSLFEKTLMQPIPPFLSKGTDLKADIKMVNFRSKEVFEKEMEAENLKFLQEERESMEDYASKNNLTTQSTPSGLRYVMLQEGKGAEADSGMMVKVKFTGKFLDGQLFDSGEYEFVIGRGEVIRGWDEGIGLLKVGGKAILLVPSELGYGHRGVQGVIPPYASLVFEVELLKVSKPEEK
jgi:FKBP-type peptidyl-prolyl cis-trans isomerase